LFSLYVVLIIEHLQHSKLSALLQIETKQFAFLDLCDWCLLQIDAFEDLLKSIPSVLRNFGFTSCTSSALKTHFQCYENRDKSKG